MVHYLGLAEVGYFYIRVRIDNPGDKKFLAQG